MTYVNKLKDRIGEPNLIVCLDSGCNNYEQLWLSTSLRGVVNLDLTVECLNEAIHSGEGTGFAPDSFMIIRSLLERVEDNKTGKILVNECHVDIPEIRVQEADKVGKILGKDTLTKIKFKESTQPMCNDYKELLLNNTWRPTLAIVGASGLPESSIAGNVLRASTTLRLSFRIPPTGNTKKIAEKLNEILTKDPPYNSKITCKLVGAGDGWNANDISPKMKQSLDLSSQKIFGKETLSFGCGGSIPFIKQLGDIFTKSDFLVIGILGPNSNAHSVNEGLHIPYTKKITQVCSHCLADLIC